MKVLFWIMCILLGIILLYLIRGFFFVLLRENTPVDRSSLITTGLLILAGIILVSGGGYLYYVGKFNWACLVLGSPLLAIFGFFFLRIILPVMMGGKMN
ncbi:MAG TPA: hypothetical protein VK644_03015 [Chitinophagaceae bacterium]|nr:hypothetical protein [Chitinophagaceae bacterium]